MARIFITGSTDGLGRMAAELLIDQGHQVVLHARNSLRAQDLATRLPSAKDIVIGDLSSITQTREVAEQVNRLGRCDAVILLSNALEPGWVPTKMGGPAAPDDMNQAHRTQAWLAVSDDAEARVTGQYFYHLKQRAPDPITRDAARQDGLVSACERLTGIVLPAT